MTKYYVELTDKDKTRRAGPYPTEKMAQSMVSTYEPLFQCEGKVVKVVDE